MASLKRLALLHDFDVIMITETWLADSTPNDLYSLPGYRSFLNNRLYRTGGGCLAYVKNSLPVEALHHPTLDNIQDSIWFSILLHPQPLFLGCICRPPGKCNSDLSLIVDAFNYLSYLPSGGKVIAGDFNLPSINWSSLEAPYRLLPFMSCLREGQWSQHVSSPTRCDNILDLIFTSGLSRVTASVFSKFPGSDHRLVTCHISTNLSVN
ncbi:endonuclease/exonuclease/phosphatase family protein, partial [Streptococcus dysgalactiae subsp. equisimilis]|nr:endonuclease/exonuclease/phosphatase family protein [Streptococcus dysgalactiae subsp. equisimilis]